MIIFNVNFDAGPDDLAGKTVLVFLKPQHPQRDDQIHAWQILHGVAGSTESFQYHDSISTDVSSRDRHDEKIISKREHVSPGQLLSVVSPNGVPVLQPAPVSVAQEKLTPLQCGIINKTHPFIQFDSNWYVNDKPVVTRPRVDMHTTVSFEYMPSFYFMLAPPPKAGQTYIVQNFSDMTHYVPPVTASDVHVRLYLFQGYWNFEFMSA